MACFRFHILNTMYHGTSSLSALTYIVLLNQNQKGKNNFVERFAAFHKQILHTLCHFMDQFMHTNPRSVTKPEDWRAFYNDSCLDVCTTDRTKPA